MTHRDPEPSDFVGKKIVGFDGDAINIWRFNFDDGTKLAIEAEHFGNDLWGMVICDECAESQQEVKSALDDHHLKAEECDIVIPLSEQGYKTPEDMQDYWQNAIGDAYKPVKYGRSQAGHPKTVADVLAKLKAGELCPEAADVIVALIHEQWVAWNIADALSKQKITIGELAKMTRQDPS